MSQQDDNLATVRAIYDAFGRGDVEAILERVTDDVDWSAEAASTAAPWYGPRSGKSAVADFFGDLSGAVEVEDFTPISLAAGDDDVHAFVRFAFRAPATDRRAAMHLHHYWRLRDGKVAYYRGTEDTEQTAHVLAG
jgi:ketosteroid isomerase-like protein